MKRLCQKIQNSIILFLKLLLYVLVALCFYGIMGIKNAHMLVLSRTSVIIAFAWVVMLVMLNNIYGGYDIGIRRKKQIFLSLAISTIIIDVVAYLMLNIMNRNDDNNQSFKIEFFGMLIIIMILQLLINAVFVKLGDAFFRYISIPKKTLIITGEQVNDNKVRAALKSIPGNFEVVNSLYDNSPKLYDSINSVDAVFIYNIEISHRTEIVNYCYKYVKDVYFNPEVADILEHSASQLMLNDMTFLALGYHGMSFEQRVMKRLIDIAISTVALIISSPVFLVAAIAIKKADGGSVFFRQKRATVNGKVFEIYKFRTMKENVENFSSTKDDDRITSPGKFLRRYRLDELPQFINILKGEMSVVGPRPEMLKNVDEYTKEMPEFKYRLRMKAGLTGYAQILGKYNTSSKDKLMLDLLYIENFSILKDISLIFQTVTVLFDAEDSTEAF